MSCKFRNEKRLTLCALGLAVTLAFGTLTAEAGSISDDIGSTEAQPFSCDNRVEQWSTANSNWCSRTTADRIRTSCFVVIHSTPLLGRQCSWQGCQNFSLIGQPATLSGSSIVEYGLPTVMPAGTTYESVSGGILPKRPYPRHYLKAGAALTAKRACPSNPLNLPSDVHSAICNASGDVLNLNMYWSCLQSF